MTSFQNDLGKARLKAVDEVLRIVKLEKPRIVGLGSGSTISLLLDRMADLGLNDPIFACSSLGTSLKLSSYGFKVLSLESLDWIDLYVDVHKSFIEILDEMKKD